jgi:hypothetical protein
MCDPDTSAVLSVYVLWHASHLGARAKTNKELLDNVYNSVLNRNNLVGTIPDGIDGLVNMLNMYVCCTHVSCSMCHLLVLMPLLSLTLTLSLSGVCCPLQRPELQYAFRNNSCIDWQYHLACSTVCSTQFDHKSLACSYFYDTRTLSTNRLTGSIPSTITQLTLLDEMYVSRTVQPAVH